MQLVSFVVPQVQWGTNKEKSVWERRTDSLFSVWSYGVLLHWSNPLDVKYINMTYMIRYENSLALIVSYILSNQTNIQNFVNNQTILLMNNLNLCSFQSRVVLFNNRVLILISIMTCFLLLLEFLKFLEYLHLYIYSLNKPYDT